MRKPKLNRIIVFDILKGEMQAYQYAEKYNIAVNTVYGVKRGKLYKTYYDEFQEYSKKQAIQVLTKSTDILNNITSIIDNCYFYKYCIYISPVEISMSFDIFLITINIKTKEVKLNYNTIIKGELINYDEFKDIMIKNKIIL